MPNFMSSVSREIATLHRSLKAIDRSLRRLAPKLRNAGNGRANARAGRPARTLKLSPKRRAQLRLQGMYMGYMRQLDQKGRAAVRSILTKKGMRVAAQRAQLLVARS